MIRKIRTKFLSLFMSFSICMGLLSGLCGCGENKDLQETEKTVGGIENALDDNYRNYYEIFVYSFYDSDEDGIGDINGLTQKLDYVADLGCNGIWLMPVMSSTTYHKYDVTDYYTIDSEYGTNEDFANMVNAAHEKGIRVIIDFVINHSSSQNKWFLEACKYLRSLNDGEEPDESVCPYYGYYHFSEKKESGTWYPVSGTKYYYEGQFWSEMPDLNLSNEALRKELEEIADYWMSLGVDGFRMDAPLHFEEGDTDFNTATLSWLFEYCKAKNPDFYMVSEVWSDKNTIAKYYASNTPSFFNFAAGNTEGLILKTAMGSAKAERFVNSMVEYRELFGSAYSDYIDAPFITNHDMGRACNVVQSDADALKIAAGLLSTMSGSTFMYYGEEIGMKSKGKKDENKRLPMNWSSTDLTGLTNGPKDADKGITQTFDAVDAQMEDEDSILNYYKRALAMRNSIPEIARGVEEVLPQTEGNLALISKTYEDRRIYIAYNTDKEEAAFDVSSLNSLCENGVEVIYSLTLHDEEIPFENGILTMPGRSICILQAKE